MRWPASTFTSTPSPFYETKLSATGEAEGLLPAAAQRIAGGGGAARRCWTWNLGITALVLGAGQRAGLVRLAAHRQADPGAGRPLPRQIAKGDLTQRADVGSGDEIGSLAEAFNAMAANLEKTVKNLMQSQAQAQIGRRDGGQPLAALVIARVDEQRSIIDDTYNSIDQLNGGVRKITDNVEALSASSEETSSSMLEMVASMEEVSRHTDTLFTSVEDTASATHADGLLDQRGRPERRLPDELRHRHLGVDGGDVRLDRPGRGERRPLVRPRPWPWPTRRSRG